MERTLRSTPDRSVGQAEQRLAATIVTRTGGGSTCACGRRPMPAGWRRSLLRRLTSGARATAIGRCDPNRGPSMPSPKLYWVIDITKGFKSIFRKRLPGHLHTREVATILQRLASRDLSPMDIVAASIRKPLRTALLEVRVDGPPRGGRRNMIWLPECPDYKASRWREDELAEYPEIFPEEK
jgi:hypothetical protein